MLNNELSDKYLDVVPEQIFIVILDSNSAVFMANNVKDTKHTIQISIRMNFVINGEECNLHNIVWCEIVLQLADIGTNNFKEDEFNTIL